MKKLIAIGILFLFTGSYVRAQFGLSAELRPRVEYSHGYATLANENQDPSIFTSQRTRLNFDYSMDLLNVGIQLQDVRIWGNQPQQVGNEDFATSIHQAWAEINFTPVVILKVGRQELVYDDHRIFGNVGWAQQARSHDLALFKYTGEVNVHLGIAHHENTNRTDNFYDGPDAYKDMQFLWVNQSMPSITWSLLFLNNGRPVTTETDQKTAYSQTFGTHINIPLDRLSFAGNFYYQTGEDGARSSLKAWNALAELNFQLTNATQFGLGYEILSGTDYDVEEKNKSFTPFYGTNHKFNGFMDYFYVGNHLNSVGLHDAYVKFITGTANTIFNLDIHYFASAAEIAAGANKYLGTELDLTLTQVINPATRVSFGYSHMFPGESMEILKGGSQDATHNWAYIMLTVTPSFL
ncbi:MAG TPA: alginate export family protein [Prolixibacteraceae bacterium]|nr:alginate export family protein [Prolixibacteraceae bacterium]